jgi:hypothetical protein
MVVIFLFYLINMGDYDNVNKKSGSDVEESHEIKRTKRKRTRKTKQTRNNTRKKIKEKKRKSTFTLGRNKGLQIGGVQNKARKVFRKGDDDGVRDHLNKQYSLLLLFGYRPTTGTMIQHYGQPRLFNEYYMDGEAVGSFHYLMNHGFPQKQEEQQWVAAQSRSTGKTYYRNKGNPRLTTWNRSETDLPDDIIGVFIILNKDKYSMRVIFNKRMDDILDPRKPNRDNPLYEYQDSLDIYCKPDTDTDTDTPLYHEGQRQGKRFGHTSLLDPDDYTNFYEYNLGTAEDNLSGTDYRCNDVVTMAGNIGYSYIDGVFYWTDVSGHFLPNQGDVRFVKYLDKTKTGWSGGVFAEACPPVPQRPESNHDDRPIYPLDADDYASFQDW